MPKAIIPRNPKNPAYKSIPDVLLGQLPKLYATEKQDDPLAYVKLFTPDSSWTWYITEYDPEERLCFGLAIGHETELGYFSLCEIEEVRGPHGLPIERDLSWNPTPLSKCRQE